MGALSRKKEIGEKVEANAIINPLKKFYQNCQNGSVRNCLINGGREGRREC
jgi:hypothetical protein